MTFRRLAPAMLATLASLGATAQTAQTDTTQPAPEAAAAAAEAPPSAAETAAESPRARYNAALALLDAGTLEPAVAEFLAARDAAGPDPTLRYRAAFNLGVALAAQTDAGEAKPEETLAALRSSAAWFHDAVRLAPEGDDDARINLEIVLRRIERLADSINRDTSLEARLDRIIDDQRGARDGIRGLLTAVAAQGAGTEPTGFGAEFEALAVRERTLLAEASTVADLGAAESARLGHMDADAQTPEQRARGAQLLAMERYLQRARQSLSDARRRLRRLEGERAHRRADAALAELKRAREQLQDPVTTLQAILRDERRLIAHTRALAAFNGGDIKMEGGDVPASPPPWLTPRHLTNRQEDAAARTGQALTRIEAAATAPAPSAGHPPGDEADPATQRLRRAAAEAVPHLQDGLAAMRSAIAALENEAFGEGVAQEQVAARSLSRAIERFADLRALIELAWADQSGAVALLAPPGDDEPDGAAALPEAQRLGAVVAVVADNLERLERLAPLLQEAAQEATSAPPDAADQASGQATAGQRHERAETLRTAALAELERMRRVVNEPRPSRARALPPAQGALEHLAELRRLFFNIVEHLQALAADQSNTHDGTATLQFESDVDGLATELGLLAERQAAHASLGDALADALERQAQAATQAPPAGAQAQPPASDGEALSEAAAAVRAGAGNMHGANVIMAAAVDAAAASSPDLEPALDEQIAAVERLQDALRLLQPPRDDPQGGADEQPAAANQAAQSPPEKSPEQADQRMSQRQALRRLQAIRDRDAERQRERRHAPGQPHPVEKDW